MTNYYEQLRTIVAKQSDDWVVEHAPLFLYNFELLSKSQLENKSLLLRLCPFPEFSLSYLDTPLRGDKEVALALVQRTPRELEWLSEELRGDREVVLEAVRREGNCVCHASKELQDDGDVATAAIASCPDALKYVSDRLKQKLKPAKSSAKRKQK
eukprot:CAMPEP_0182810250 /NCGR_PEP_ID=MMETSP0006_2-20121128/7627_1 /TAXON_ID=97485 /ORGANISM="Prymnesium parvum, Strain Texoma1" /LENGTH=154 /DNA_ID=CAMNT_0024936109 /DNA_START=396 /DNA_END=860 /DNA_ORIENTATION=+